MQRCHRWGQGVAAATKEGGKRGQRVVVVSSPVVVDKGRKGQGVAAAITKQGGERKRGQSRAVASSSSVPVVGGRSEMIVTPPQEPVITIINDNLITHVDDLFSAAVLKHGLELDRMKVSDFHRTMAERIGGALDKKAKRAIKGRLMELMMDLQQRNVADEIGLIFKMDGKEGKETKVCLRDIGSYISYQ